MHALGHKENKRAVGWVAIQHGHKSRWLEALAEKCIYLVSLSAIVMVFLIFLFVAREAFPVFLGRMNSGLVQPVNLLERHVRPIPDATRHA